MEHKWLGALAVVAPKNAKELDEQMALEREQFIKLYDDLKTAFQFVGGDQDKVTSFLRGLQELIESSGYKPL